MSHLLKLDRLQKAKKAALLLQKLGKTPKERFLGKKGVIAANKQIDKAQLSHPLNTRKPIVNP